MKLTLPQFIQIIILTVIFTSCSPEDDGIYFNNSLATKVYHSDLELDILQLVNNYRSSIGKKELSRLDVISSVASTHTKYMAEIKEVNHDNFPERHLKLVQNANAKSVGENVAFGYSSADAVVKAWINSSEHKNILDSDDFTHFGISTKSDDEGRLYFTQIFIKK
jgi:uncharacterized protein YkwD